MPNFKKMFGSQVQMPFSPSLTSERQGQKLWAVPRGIYQVIQNIYNIYKAIGEEIRVFYQMLRSGHIFL